MAVIIFKPIRRCNANCIYCDVIKKDQDKIMDFNLVKVIFQKINEYLLSHPLETIKFTWHGGEVCMLGADYFFEVLNIQDKYCTETGSRIEHLVQSNITMINQKIIDALIALGVKTIGTSFDPVAGIRGLGKKRDSYLYAQKFLQGVNLLRDNNIRWSIIYVVHKKSIDKASEIFYYLTNLNIEGSPTFNKLHIYGNEYLELKIEPEEYADFLGNLLPIYWNNRNSRYIEVIPISNFVKKIENNNAPLLCVRSGNCAYNSIYIGPEGDTSHCGSTADFNIINYGNILTQSLDQIYQNEERKLLSERQEYLQKNECKDCRFWGICHGECPIDAFMEYKTFLKPSPNCLWIKIFIEKYFEPITGLAVDLPPGRKNNK